MSWISFWIKPEAVPARVTLCVTSLLTLSTQHAQSQKSLPPVSYIKAIDIFMSSCTVFVFASLMEYALVNILMADELLNGGFGGLNWSFEPTTTTPATNPNLISNIKSTNERRKTESKTTTKQRCSTTESGTVNNNNRYQQQQQQRINDRLLHHQHHHHPKQLPPSIRSLSLSRLDLDSKLNDFSNNNDDDDDGNDDDDDDDDDKRFKHQNNNVKTNGSTLRNRIGSIFNYDNNNLIKKKKKKIDSKQPSIEKSFCLYTNSNDNVDRCNIDDDNVDVNIDDDDNCFSNEKPPKKDQKYFHQRKTTFDSRNDIQFNLDQSINQFLLQSKHRRAYTVDHISRWIFPLSFTILNIVYWLYYLNVCNECSVW